jgi:AcrR family transcriptional regulator
MGRKMSEPAKSKAPPSNQGARTYDPDRVRRDILAVATEEIAEHGFSGARVDKIAEKTQTSKRMIYYYFTDKEHLFVAVLEEAYARIRDLERAHKLSGLSPVEALRRLTELTFDFHNSDPHFVRLVMVENIHNAVHIDQSDKLQTMNLSAIETVAEIYKRGVKEGVFRDGIDVTDIHLTISALSFFHMSNRATFSKIYKRDMASAKALAKRRKVASDTVLRFVLK